MYNYIAGLMRRFEHYADFAKLLAEDQKQIGVKGTTVNMSTKEQFRRWLSTNPFRKYKPDAIIKALGEGSDYCHAHSALCVPAPVQSEEERMKVYQKLYSISKVYDDPAGLSIEKIMTLLGNGVDEQLARSILEDASWATKLSDNVYSFSKKTWTALRESETPYVAASAYITDTAFFNYLNKQVGMAEPTCRSYVSAIRTAESYARDHHYMPISPLGRTSERKLMSFRRSHNLSRKGKRELLMKFLY